jgi:hypothetical protein
MGPDRLATATPIQLEVVNNMSRGLVEHGAQGWSRSGIALRSTSARATSIESLLLFAAGACAALLVALVHIKVRVPGHIILQAIVPVALGAAMIPRRFAGTIAGAGAAVTSGAMLWTGWGEMPVAALASLVLLGPALDVAARGTHALGILVARFCAAGLATNLIALSAKVAANAAGLEAGGGRGFAALWPYSLLTYCACGVTAGMIGAAIALAAERRRRAG